MPQTGWGAKPEDNMTRLEKAAVMDKWMRDRALDRCRPKVTELTVRNKQDKSHKLHRELVPKAISAMLQTPRHVAAWLRELQRRATKSPLAANKTQQACDEAFGLLLVCFKDQERFKGTGWDPNAVAKQLLLDSASTAATPAAAAAASGGMPPPQPPRPPVAPAAAASGSAAPPAPQASQGLCVGGKGSAGGAAGKGEVLAPPCGECKQPISRVAPHSWQVWECDGCLKKAAKTTPLYGCATYDDCDYGLCGACFTDEERQMGQEPAGGSAGSKRAASSAIPTTQRRGSFMEGDSSEDGDDAGGDGLFDGGFDIISDSGSDRADPEVDGDPGSPDARAQRGGPSAGAIRFTPAPSRPPSCAGSGQAAPTAAAAAPASAPFSFPPVAKRPRRGGGPPRGQ
eukprot:TRINITY_DN24493_c0_g1_i1.p1 TRINITY_DN24493_c0_g1~~TRINITY_DN24493_c0_g1_i1.p1  ORF type:complete len:399 (+),score=69.35 TRINITY_DN24493_c0_g1_i1:87-1283(+)